MPATEATEPPVPTSRWVQARPAIRRTVPPGTGLLVTVATQATAQVPRAGPTAAIAQVPPATGEREATIRLHPVQARLRGKASVPASRPSPSAALVISRRRRPRPAWETRAVNPRRPGGLVPSGRRARWRHVPASLPRVPVPKSFFARRSSSASSASEATINCLSRFGNGRYVHEVFYSLGGAGTVTVAAHRRWRNTILLLAGPESQASPGEPTLSQARATARIIGAG
jgi:hypothetical protein